MSTSNRRIYIRDQSGRETTWLSADHNEIKQYSGTETKMAVSPGIFSAAKHGRRPSMRSSDVIEFDSLAIDIDARTQTEWLTREQVEVLLSRIPIPFRKAARCIWANGLTIWFHFPTTVEASRWPELVRGLVRIACEICRDLDWAFFDRSTLIRADGSPANRQNAVFRYHPSWADKRRAMTEIVSDGITIDSGVIIEYGTGYTCSPVPRGSLAITRGRSKCAKHNGSLRSQARFIEAVAFFIENGSSSDELMKRFDLSSVEANKIINFRTMLDAKIHRKVLLHTRSKLPLLPNTPIEGVTPLTDQQRYIQKTFNAIGYLGWFYYYLKQKALTFDQGWKILLGKSQLTPLRKVVVRHWTKHQAKRDFIIWDALFGSSSIKLISDTLLSKGKSALDASPHLSVRKLAALLGVSMTQAHRIKRACS